MKTREELKKELEESLQASLAAFDAETEIRSKLPPAAGEPKFVHHGGFFRPRPHITYEITSLEQAVSIIEAYGALEEVAAKERGCLSVAVVGEHSAEYAEGKERWSIPELIEVRQHGGKGFYSAEVVFYPVSPKVRVDLKFKWTHGGAEGFPHDYRATISARYGSYGDVLSAVFGEPYKLVNKGVKKVKWGAGSQDAFDFAVYFSGLEQFKKLLEKEEVKA